MYNADMSYADKVWVAIGGIVHWQVFIQMKRWMFTSK